MTFLTVTTIPDAEGKAIVDGLMDVGQRSIRIACNFNFGTRFIMGLVPISTPAGFLPASLGLLPELTQRGN